MNKKITSVLFSTRLMAILFLTFAIAMGAGTFIESKYNTRSDRRSEERRVGKECRSRKI